ncbi:MAG: hypothetical protein IPL96_01810 [Holophagaceae bacterium]|nr:hypothetical protein [Holophagaceae bacterium]
MLQDFPTIAPASAPPPAPSGPDPLTPGLRRLWWLTPLALVGYDLLLTVWHQLLRFGLSSGFNRVAVWLPWLLNTGLVLGAVAWLWSRRSWPTAIQAGLLAAAALPLVRLGTGQMLAMGGFYRVGGLGFLVQGILGPVLSLGLAIYAVSLRRGQGAEDRVLAAPGVLAVAVAAALSGGWIAWGLLPLLSRFAGDGLAEELADPATPVGAPTPISLKAAGWAGFACAFACWLVPLVGLLRFRVTYGAIYLVEGIALLAGCLTWTVLGARWSKGRTEGRVLRVLTWLALGLPLLLGLLALVILLVFWRPRLF